MLHVGEIDGSIRRSKIQPFLDLVIPSFQQYFVPGKALAVDEAMIAYRGRVSFRQYVRGKPHPWGIKAYVFADSDTGYLYSVAIYYDKETLLVSCPGLNHTTRVVLTLVQPVRNMGYDLYTDRFYTSPLLARELANLGITLTGTVMANRKDSPWLYGQKGRGREEPPRYTANKICLSWSGRTKEQSLHCQRRAAMVWSTRTKLLPSQYIKMEVYS